MDRYFENINKSFEKLDETENKFEKLDQIIKDIEHSLDKLDFLLHKRWRIIQNRFLYPNHMIENTP